MVNLAGRPTTERIVSMNDTDVHLIERYVITRLDDGDRPVDLRNAGSGCYYSRSFISKPSHCVGLEVIFVMMRKENQLCFSFKLSRRETLVLWITGITRVYVDYGIVVCDLDPGCARDPDEADGHLSDERTMVEMAGFEPATFALRTRRSPN